MSADMSPAVLVNPDNADPVEAGGVGGHDELGGLHRDRVDGVPGQAQLPCHRRHGRAIDHQPTTDVAGAAPRGRPSPPCQAIGVVGEHFSLTISGQAPVTRDPHPQPERVTDDRHIGHCAHHRVAVDTLDTSAWTVPATVIEQSAEHHRRHAVDRSVGHRHPKFDSAHNRVGNNASSAGRRVRHRAPRIAGMWRRHLHLLLPGARLSPSTRPSPADIRHPHLHSIFGRARRGLQESWWRREGLAARGGAGLGEVTGGQFGA